MFLREKNEFNKIRELINFRDKKNQYDMKSLF